MKKHERVYLRRQSAVILAGLENLYRHVKMVAVRDYGVVESHHEHLADITIALASAAPGLVGEASILDELNEYEAAEQVVLAGLKVLAEVDEHVFDGPPSVELGALLAVGANADADTLTSALCSSDYQNLDMRRRSALQAKRRLKAAGLPVPCEADAHHLPSRDRARADQFKQGGGTRGSARNNG